ARIRALRSLLPQRTHRALRGFPGRSRHVAPLAGRSLLGDAADPLRAPQEGVPVRPPPGGRRPALRGVRESVAARGLAAAPRPRARPLSRHRARDATSLRLWPLENFPLPVPPPKHRGVLEGLAPPPEPLAARLRLPASLSEPHPLPLPAQAAAARRFAGRRR